MDPVRFVISQMTPEQQGALKADMENPERRDLATRMLRRAL